MASGDIALAIAALHTDENGLRARTRRARATRGTGPSDHQPGGNGGQRRPPDRGPARVQAVRDHGRARRGGGPAAGGTGRGCCRSSPGGTGQGCCRSGHFGVSQPPSSTSTTVQELAPAPPARRPASTVRRATRRCPPSSNASCRPSQAVTTTPSRRGVRTWEVSSSARRRGTRRPSWPACRSSSTSPRTRRLRPSRTTSPLRFTTPMASSPGTTPAGRVRKQGRLGMTHA